MYSKTWFKFLILASLLLGILFRGINLDGKIYWVDEVATSLRISGYTKQEVIEQISAQGAIAASDLQKYQQLNAERGFADTWTALTRSPEHAPLYFVMARLWGQHVGSSAAAIRSLSVGLSLLALPCLYWLGIELFHSAAVAQLAIALSAVSPFYAAYAQEARPYSLWTVTILLSSATLLRSLRLNTSKNWALYAISLVLAFYTSLLSILVALGQGIYVAVINSTHPHKILKPYLIALSISLLAFAPWLWIIAEQWHQLQDNTTWMRSPMPLPAMIAVWLYSIVIIFVDFPVYLPVDPIILGAIFSDLVILALVGYSIYFLCLRTSRSTHLFVLTLALVTPFSLILIDLVLGRQASTAPRYLIPLHLGIQLAIAFLLIQKLYPTFYHRTAHSQRETKQRRIWSIITVLLLSIGVASGLSNIERSPRYQKTRNLHNPAIAQIINRSASPFVLAEPAGILDLISLSYSLKEDVKVQLTESNRLPTLGQCQNLFLLNPSPIFLDSVQSQSLPVEQVYKPNLLIPGEISLSLWSIKDSASNCSTPTP